MFPLGLVHMMGLVGPTDVTVQQREEVPDVGSAGAAMSRCGGARIDRPRLIEVGPQVSVGGLDFTSAARGD